jgi:hypothetical protein
VEVEVKQHKSPSSVNRKGIIAEAGKVCWRRMNVKKLVLLSAIG